MKQRHSSPVRRGSGGLRQRIIQRLQILVLVFVIILLSLKIYIQMFPNTFEPEMKIPCGKCTIHENPSENIDNESIPIDDIDYNYSEEETEAQPTQPIQTTQPIRPTQPIQTTQPIRQIQPALYPLPPKSDKDYDFTLVTGASENHFCPTKSFLYMMKGTLKGFNARVILYDLGFSNSQRRSLKRLQKLGYFTELRKFNWSHYPSFWNISESRGEYAWKPGMVAEVARDYPGKLVWLDSGTLVAKRYFRNLDYLLKKYKGFISPRSSGTMETWTHPGVYEYFNDNKNYNDVINCNGAAVAFDTVKTKSIIDEWFKCALVKDCIAPPGSSRDNHRQDQAILTYLAAKNNLFCNFRREKFGIHTHEDRFCRNYIDEYESTHKL